MLTDMTNDATTCSCTTNPTCPDHGDALPDDRATPDAHDNPYCQCPDCVNAGSDLADTDPA